MLLNVLLPCTICHFTRQDQRLILIYCFAAAMVTNTWFRLVVDSRGVLDFLQDFNNLVQIGFINYPYFKKLPPKSYVLI
jgi:hypothetical protein